MTDISSDVHRRERLILLVLAAAQFINMIDFTIVMPLGPRLMETLEIGPSEFGLIVSCYTFAASLAGLLAALLIDRFDRRTSLLFALTGFTLGTIGCGLAADYPLLLAARAVAGMFGGMLGGLGMTIIGEVFPDERRGTATGVLISAFALASVVGVPLGLFVGRYLDNWHAPFWILGVAALGVLALAAWQLPHLRGHLTSRRPNPLVELQATISRPVNQRAILALVLVVMSAFLIVPYLASYYQWNLGIAEPSLPWIYVVGGAVTLLSAPAIGRLADRVGRTGLFCVLATTSAGMMLLVTVLPPVPLAVAALATAGLMSANSGRMIVAMTIVNSAIDPRRRGSFMSLSSSVQHLASGLGAYLGGMIIGGGQGGPLTRYGLVGLAAAGTALASIVVMTGLRPEADSDAAARTLPEGAHAPAELELPYSSVPGRSVAGAPVGAQQPSV